MTNTEIIFQLLQYLIPAIIFFGAVLYFTKRWYDIENKKIKLQGSLPQNHSPEKRNINSEKFFPLQIDAVQRLVLFLERISLNNIVMRELNPGLPARAFQQKLLDSIRSEYEHNLAQQVYISSEAWEVVKQSKEEVIKIINMSATKLNDTSLAGDLAQKIFEITAQLKNQPTDQAIEILKSELRKSL